MSIEINAANQTASYEEGKRDGINEAIAAVIGLHYDDIRQSTIDQAVAAILKATGVGLVAVYYDCEICGHFHPWNWNGDCRNEANRLTSDDLDKRHGENGYELRSWKDRTEADQSRRTK